MKTLIFFALICLVHSQRESKNQPPTNGKLIHRTTGPTGSHFQIVVPERPRRNNRHKLEKTQHHQLKNHENRDRSARKNNVILYDHMKNTTNTTGHFQTEKGIQKINQKPKSPKDKGSLSYKELYNYLQQLGYGIEEVKNADPSPKSTAPKKNKPTKKEKKLETIVDTQDAKNDAETNEFINFSPILNNDLLQFLPGGIDTKALADSAPPSRFLDVSQIFNNPDFVLGNPDMLKAFTEDDSKTFAETSFVTVEDDSPEHDKPKDEIKPVTEKTKVTTTEKEQNDATTEKAKFNVQREAINGTQFKFLSFNPIPSNVIPKIQKEIIRHKQEQEKKEQEKKEQELEIIRHKQEQERKEQELEKLRQEFIQQEKIQKEIQQEQDKLHKRNQELANEQPQYSQILFPIVEQPQANQKITITNQELETNIRNFHAIPSQDERRLNEQNHNSFSALATGNGVLYFNVIGNPNHKILYTNLDPIAIEEDPKGTPQVEEVTGKTEERSVPDYTEEPKIEKEEIKENYTVVQEVPVNGELRDLNSNGLFSTTTEVPKNLAPDLETSDIHDIKQIHEHIFVHVVSPTLDKVSNPDQKIQLVFDNGNQKEEVSLPLQNIQNKDQNLVYLLNGPGSAQTRQENVLNNNPGILYI